MKVEMSGETAKQTCGVWTWTAWVGHQSNFYPLISIFVAVTVFPLTVCICSLADDIAGMYVKELPTLTSHPKFVIFKCLGPTLKAHNK